MLNTQSELLSRNSKGSKNCHATQSYRALTLCVQLNIESETRI